MSEASLALPRVNFCTVKDSYRLYSLSGVLDTREPNVNNVSGMRR
jgi:hypothetical protein